MVVIMKIKGYTILSSKEKKQTNSVLDVSWKCTKYSPLAAQSTALGLLSSHILAIHLLRTSGTQANVNISGSIWWKQMSAGSLEQLTRTVDAAAGMQKGGWLSFYPGLISLQLSFSGCEIGCILISTAPVLCHNSRKFFPS